VQPYSFSDFSFPVGVFRRKKGSGSKPASEFRSKNQILFIMHVPDVCRLLNNKYKVPFVGKKQNSKRFPEGLKVS
jgi:hypothetical protein